MDRSLPVAAAVVAVVLVCCSGLCRANRLGARECEGLGFTGLALCSDCNALSECEGLGFTWEGPGGVVEGQLNPAAPAIDPNDPNYEEQEEGGGAAEDEAVDREVVVGEVEVAESRDGVATVDVALLQEQNQ